MKNDYQQDIQDLKDYIKDEIGKIVRRQDSLQNSIDLINADREILENIQGRLTSLEEQTKLSRQSDKEAQKNISYQINKVDEAVRTTIQEEVGEMKDVIESKKILRIKEKFSFFNFMKKKVNIL